MENSLKLPEKSVRSHFHDLCTKQALGASFLRLRRAFLHFNSFLSLWGGMMMTAQTPAPHQSSCLTFPSSLYCSSNNVALFPLPFNGTLTISKLVCETVTGDYKSFPVCLQTKKKASTRWAMSSDLRSCHCWRRLTLWRTARRDSQVIFSPCYFHNFSLFYSFTI